MVDDGGHESCADRRPGLSKSPTAASFVRPTRPADRPQGFVSALREKYASEAADSSSAAVAAAAGGGTGHRQIVISGKVAEEVGFDKIRRRLARVEDLKIVILDGMRVVARPAEGEATEKSVRETCPVVVELDLSRNLFETFGEVVGICGQLDKLKSLRVR